MIQAEELRIGNWVIHYNPLTGKSVYHQVTAGTFSKFPFHAREYEPIPLTPELLELCGFVTHEEGKLLKINEQLFLYYGHLEKIIRLCFFEIDFSYPIYLRQPVYHFQYLHQLQNLYRDFTGEELPVKL